MFYPELKGPALEAHNAARLAILDKARKEGALADDDIVIRPLRMDDLYATPNGSADYNIGLTANDFATSILVNNQTMDNLRWVAITGVYNATPLAGTAATTNTTPMITQVKIQRKGADTRYWDVKMIGQWRHKTGWADDPVVIDQNTPVTIQLYSRAAGSISTSFGLLGLVAEKRGKLINP